MAINEPIISAGHTLVRGDIKDQRFYHKSINPTEVSDYVVVDDDGNLQILSTTPSVEGQMWFYKNSSSSAALYVAIDKNGVLTWVPVRGYILAINRYTGQRWNPLTA